jgi:low affinity Fe/Cu permease
MRRRRSHLTHLAEQFSGVITRWTGSTIAFVLACLVIVVWGATGPLFGYSDTWQLVINTGTTVVTFLMVFLIERSQNKDSLAIQLKLNELVAAMAGASNRLIDCEERPLADDVPLRGGGAGAACAQGATEVIPVSAGRESRWRRRP